MMEFIEKYINDKGIVVEHPGTLQQQLEAILAYAETCENDALSAEKERDALIADVKRLRINIANMGVAVKEIKDSLSEINYWSDWAYCDGLCDKAIKVSLKELDRPKIKTQSDME